MDITSIFAVVNKFFSTFGSPIIISIILFFICLAFKVKAKNSFVSVLYAAIGLMGFTWVINEYVPVVVPVVMNMVKDTGVNLPGVDVGWAAIALVAYSAEAGMIYLILGTIFQLILFLTKFTNVFQPSGVWDQYQYAVCGGRCTCVEGSGAGGVLHARAEPVCHDRLRDAGKTVVNVLRLQELHHRSTGACI